VKNLDTNYLNFLDQPSTCGMLILPYMEGILVVCVLFYAIIDKG